MGAVSPAAGSAAVTPHAALVPPTLRSASAVPGPALPSVTTDPSSLPTRCANVGQANYPEVNPKQRALKEECAYDAARASVSVPGWVSESANPPSFYLYDFVMTYDSTDGYVVLFGAPVLPSATAPAETWTYHGGLWTHLRTVGATPSSCVSSAFANDPSDRYVVYFAGTALANGSSCPSAGESWTYHAGAWKELSPSVSPSARSASSFTNDSADGALLLFGGLNATGGVLGDTWAFSAGAWTKLAPTTSPSNRSSAGMTYDASDGYVLLFGGSGVAGGLGGPGGSQGNVYTMENDTWTFSGGTWTNITHGAAPPQPQPDGLAYDAADGYALYTQICWNYSGPYYGPSELTWAFSSGTWSRLTGSCTYQSGGPTQRLGEQTTYDAADGYFLLFGGGGSWAGDTPELHDTWSWYSGNWTNRTAASSAADLPEVDPAVTYDAAEDAAILFGGSDPDTYSPTNVTWERVGASWTELPETTAPSPRAEAAFAYDASDGYAVLFGGSDGNQSFGDTWEFLGGVWTELTPSVSPSPRGDPVMVYDAADGYLVLFGAGGYPDTWTFHAGVWTNITTTAGAPSRCGFLPNPLAYDASDGYILAFGTYDGACATLTNQTWEFSSGTWTNLTAGLPAAPMGVQGAAIAGMGPTGGVVLFGGDCWGCPGTGFPTVTWRYLSGEWTDLPSAVGPSGRSDASFVYDASASEGLLFGGYGGYSNTGSGYLNDSWFWVEGAGPNPLVMAFHATVPVVDVGNATAFAASVLGGTAPLTYSYTGLPPGCLSGNDSTLACTPTANASGTYWVTVQVTDDVGNVSTGTTGLTVDADPTVATFTAGPANVSVGSRTILRATVGGGTAPYRYLYAGLPTGCVTQTVPALPCDPSTTGAYGVTVTITDADARTASATVTVDVADLVAGRLTVTGFAASPAQLVLGNATFLNVTANSTSAPLSYAYSGLPTGCASANQSSLDCLPTAPGTYTVQATVSDTAGDSVTAFANITVFASGMLGLLHVLSFGVTPASVPLGATVVLYVLASGGNGTLSYSYLDLPAGCASEDAVTLSCRPLDVGSYHVTIAVTDPSGHLAEVRAAFAVVADGARTPPGGSTSVSVAGGGTDLPAWLELALFGMAVLSFALLLRERPPRRPAPGRAPDRTRNRGAF
jgi:hypothetical protein